MNLLRAHGSPTHYHYLKGCRCVPCRGEWSAYQAAHYATHRDEVLARCAAHYVSHREEKAEYARVHREESRARARTPKGRAKNAAQCRAYRAAHREEHRAYCAAYYATHREELLARRAAHPEQHAAHSRNYHARKLAASGTHTAEDIAAQYERQRGKCYWRHANQDCWVTLEDGYHVDHVTPLILGGGNGPENLVIACPRCNHRKNAKHPMDFAGQMF